MVSPDKVHTDPPIDETTAYEKDSGEIKPSPSSLNDKPQQKPWILISTFLVLSTFLQSVKPSDPYIPKFMQDINGYTRDEVNQGPQFRSYSMFVSLPIVSYAAEYLIGYIPPIVFGLLCRWLAQFTFFYGNNLFWMRFSYAVFGLSHSTKVIFSAFTYSMVPVHVFHRITSYIRGANFLAHVVGGSIAQFLLDYVVIRDLNGEIISPYTSQFFVSQLCVGVGVLLFLAAIYLNYRNHSGNENALANIKPPPIHSFQDASNLLKTVYATKDLRIWSIWFVFSFACVDAIWDYQGVLFTDTDDAADYTGYITAATRLGCAFSAVVAGRSRSLFANHDVGIIAISGFAISCFLFMSGLFRSLNIIYALFVATMLVNEYCMCSTTAQIAVRTDQSIRGIVLLLNTIFAMLFQCLMQGVFSWLHLDIRGKYQGLALCVLIATVIIIVMRFGAHIKGMVSRGAPRPLQVAA